MPQSLRALLLAATCSSAVFAAGLCLPLWKQPTIGGDVDYESVPVWQGMTDRRWIPPLEARAVRDDNRTTCLILLAVAGGVGAFVYWVRRPRMRPLEADDYADGLGGPRLDGRVPR